MLEIVNQAGAIIGLIALLSGAIVYLYGTAKRGRQDIVRQDNVDLRSSNQELRQERAVLEAKTNEQANTIHDLRDIATQTPAVTQLIELNNKQQKIMTEQHVQVIQSISELTGKLSTLAAEFSGLAKAINKSHNGGK